MDDPPDPHPPLYLLRMYRPVDHPLLPWVIQVTAVHAPTPETPLPSALLPKAEPGEFFAWLHWHFDRPPSWVTWSHASRHLQEEVTDTFHAQIAVWEEQRRDCLIRTLNALNFEKDCYE